ncbi:hypothetical protein [uncultured Sphingomonas sp.]|uniref:hypothetical protein n=1 Tax=uncultured Sphingomonas sp. TaxID=158754 RepID=UPI0035CB15E0
MKRLSQIAGTAFGLILSYIAPTFGGNGVVGASEPQRRPAYRMTVPEYYMDGNKPDMEIPVSPTGRALCNAIVAKIKNAHNIGQYREGDGSYRLPPALAGEPWVPMTAKEFPHPDGLGFCDKGLSCYRFYKTQLSDDKSHEVSVIKAREAHGGLDVPTYFLRDEPFGKFQRTISSMADFKSVRINSHLVAVSLSRDGYNSIRKLRQGWRRATIEAGLVYSKGFSPPIISKYCQINIRRLGR